MHVGNSGASKLRKAVRFTCGRLSAGRTVKMSNTFTGDARNNLAAKKHRPAKSLFPRCSKALLAVFFGCSLSVLQSRAQDAVLPPGPAAIEQSAQSPAKADERYLIGPGDVLEIRVYNRPQLSHDAVRVDDRGMIRMPLLEEEIRAACRTDGELASAITAQYLKYQRKPQVYVFIKEHNTHPVSVVGAVRSPGRFQLRRRVRLQELLALAGGAAEKAGQHIQVAHDESVAVCEEAKQTASEEKISITNYRLNQILRGDDEANPYVYPGDVVTLLEAEPVYIVGNVVNPTMIPLKEPITVSRAIAMAGGTLPDTKSDRVRIIRQQSSTGAGAEIIVDLRAIENLRAEDVLLQANDVVKVPTASGRRFLRTLANAVPTSVARLPVTVVR